MRKVGPNLFTTIANLRGLGDALLVLVALSYEIKDNIFVKVYEGPHRVRLQLVELESR